MRFLADENFNNDVLRGIKRRMPDAPIIRVQDTDLIGQPDELILEFAAQQNMILLSHDVNTMRSFFYQRLNDGLPLPGLLLVHANKPVRAIIDGLELVLKASDEQDWLGRIEFLAV